MQIEIQTTIGKQRGRRSDCYLFTEVMSEKLYEM